MTVQSTFDFLTIVWTNDSFPPFLQCPIVHLTALSILNPYPLFAESDIVIQLLIDI